MKKLLLIRHAKAEKDTGAKDFDRPLKYIGMQDAAFMADRKVFNSGTHYNQSGIKN
jgi:phosphohistidine phosphatase